MGVASRVAAEPALPSAWGLVLLAPMLAPAVALPLFALVTLLSYSPLGSLPLISASATSNEKQYADPEIRREIEADTLACKGKLRVTSVAAVLQLAARTEAALEHVQTPFLCCVAERDLVLGPATREAQQRLMEVAATPPAQRALKTYDALHGLLCELPTMRAQITADIVDWLLSRVAAGTEGDGGRAGEVEVVERA